MLVAASAPAGPVSGLAAVTPTLRHQASNYAQRHGGGTMVSAAASMTRTAPKSPRGGKKVDVHASNSAQHHRGRTMVSAAFTTPTAARRQWYSMGTTCSLSSARRWLAFKLHRRPPAALLRSDGRAWRRSERTLTCGTALPLRSWLRRGRARQSPSRPSCSGGCCALDAGSLRAPMALHAAAAGRSTLAGAALLPG